MVFPHVALFFHLSVALHRAATQEAPVVLGQLLLWNRRAEPQRRVSAALSGVAHHEGRQPQNVASEIRLKMGLKWSEKLSWWGGLGACTNYQPEPVLDLTMVMETSRSHVGNSWEAGGRRQVGDKARLSVEPVEPKWDTTLYLIVHCGFGCS